MYRLNEQNPKYFVRDWFTDLHFNSKIFNLDIQILQEKLRGFKKKSSKSVKKRPFYDKMKLTLFKQYIPTLNMLATTFFRI